MFDGGLTSCAGSMPNSANSPASLVDAAVSGLSVLCLSNCSISSTVSPNLSSRADAGGLSRPMPSSVIGAVVGGKSSSSSPNSEKMLFFTGSDRVAPNFEPFFFFFFLLDESDLLSPNPPLALNLLGVSCVVLTAAPGPSSASRLCRSAPGMAGASSSMTPNSFSMSSVDSVAALLLAFVALLLVVQVLTTLSSSSKNLTFFSAAGLAPPSAAVLWGVLMLSASSTGGFFFRSSPYSGAPLLLLFFFFFRLDEAGIDTEREDVVVSSSSKMPNSFSRSGRAGTFTAMSVSREIPNSLSRSRRPASAAGMGLAFGCGVSDGLGGGMSRETPNSFSTSMTPALGLALGAGSLGVF
mmetsp:Transcript_37138/g.93227  ORF Transcript_37138/g.93227 Transcript_37138/m.93227 type:complete len:353 (+) Transcript_37138:104-1162(+)